MLLWYVHILHISSPSCCYCVYIYTLTQSHHHHSNPHTVTPSPHTLTHTTVVGEKEETNGTVNVRTRDNKVHGECKLEEELVPRLLRLKKSRAISDEAEFKAES